MALAAKLGPGILGSIVALRGLPPDSTWGQRVTAVGGVLVKKLGWDVKVLTTLPGRSTVVARLGKDAVEGLYGIGGWKLHDAESTDPAAKKFLDASLLGLEIGKVSCGENHGPYPETTVEPPKTPTNEGNTPTSVSPPKVPTVVAAATRRRPA